jgi:hypothetical protein
MQDISGTADLSGNPAPLRTVRWVLLLALLSGCASNSVTTLLKASKQTDPIVPTSGVVQSELKGRAFEVGSIAFDLAKAEDKQGPDIPDSAYLELFGTTLRKAFDGASLGTGTAPACPVNVAIEQLKLNPARFPIAEMSVFRVRMEVTPAGGETLMRGQFQSYLSGPVILVPTGSGVMIPVALPFSHQQYVALAKMFPAMAVAIATTTQGLQQGNTLDEIKVYPEDIEAGNIISPGLFLKNAPFGMTQMDYAEIRRVIRAAKARGE